MPGPDGRARHASGFPTLVCFGLAQNEDRFVGRQKEAVPAPSGEELDSRITLTVIGLKTERQMAVAFSHLLLGSEIGSDGGIRGRDASLVGRGHSLVRADRQTGAAGTQRRYRRPKEDAAEWKSAGRADDSHGLLLRRAKGTQPRLKLVMSL